MDFQIDKIYNEDCLEGMKRIADGAVDCIITDLPYGTTACAWDSVIPFEPLWEQFKRVTKPNAAIVLFGSEPFSSALRMSNIGMYKYDWIWQKNVPSGFQHAKNMPLKDYENISVFSKGSMGHANLLGERRMIYNPQGLESCHIKENGKTKFKNTVGSRPSHKDVIYREQCNYPRMCIFFDNQSGDIVNDKRLHPTQKPVDLLRYLILTYSNEGDTILDATIGSGTTAVAALMEKRHFIGFETNKEYFDIAQGRIDQVRRNPTLF